MELENKFLVLKWDDINAALSRPELELLQALARFIREYRECEGKSQNAYVVINEDEPYFSEVLKLMDERG